MTPGNPPAFMVTGLFEGRCGYGTLRQECPKIREANNA